MSESVHLCYMLTPTQTVQVEVPDTAQGRSTLAYLDEFYPQEQRSVGTEPTWRFDAALGSPGRGGVVDEFGVWSRLDHERRVLMIRTENQFDLQVSLRKRLREVFLEACELHSHAMLHASAVLSPSDRRGSRTLLVVAGEERAGKTELAVQLLLRGWQLVSNDHLIAYLVDGSTRSGDPAARLVVVGMPAVISVRVDTWARLADRLPEPIDRQGVTLDEVTTLTEGQRRDSDAAVLYSYRRLGQTSPRFVTLNDNVRPVIVLARHSDHPDHVPTAASDPVATLRTHLRTDWHAGVGFTPRYAPDLTARSAAELATDAAALLTALACQAPVLTWAHDGDPSPLLAYLAGGA